ncbi:hypothetical protein GCM10023185_15140 [Hymenobacter saemangeumensis]|uniref:DUF4178 domain-containing protein n=1 Tax=Hymenobacter saemangeumensis TaxID=1084522 RepID=A0ABP8I9M0_9BACT
MKASFAISVLLLAWSTGLVQAQDDGPRQLGAPPTVPPPPPRRTEAPRQLNTPPAPVPDTVRRAAAPAPSPAPVYEPTPAGKLPGGSTRAARYRVGLKSGMVYNVYDVEVKTPLFGRTYLLLDGQRKIEFDQVGYYEDETGHYVRTNLPGSSRESTLRRDKDGRISLYSITTTQYNSMPYGGRMGYGGIGYGGMGYGGYPYGGYRTVKTEYFSKDNGPIQNLSVRNLALATSDHAGAQQLLADARRYQKAAVASYVVGGGLLAYGLVQTLRPGQDGARLSPFMFASIPVFIVPIVMQSKQAENQRQAISLYNSTQ